jgi:hypothetical protein
VSGDLMPVDVSDWSRYRVALNKRPITAGTPEQAWQWGPSEPPFLSAQPRPPVAVLTQPIPEHRRDRRSRRYSACFAISARSSALTVSACVIDRRWPAPGTSTSGRVNRCGKM